MTVHRVAHAVHAVRGISRCDEPIDLPACDSKQFKVGDSFSDRRFDGWANPVETPGRNVVDIRVVPQNQYELGERFVADQSEQRSLRCVALFDEPREHARSMRKVLRQVGTEPNVDGMRNSRTPLDGEARIVKNFRSCTVGADHVVRAHRVRFACRTHTDRTHEVVAVAFEPEELVPEAQVGTGTPRDTEQHRLEDGLCAVGHWRRARCEIVGRPVGAGSPGIESCDLTTREAGDPQVVAHHLLWRRDSQQVGLAIEMPHDLDRALVHDVRAWCVRGSFVLVDEHVTDPVLRERGCSRQSCRPTTDDQDGRLDTCHLSIFSRGAPRED